MGSATTAALTLSVTGRFARQGRDAAEGVRQWADETGVRLTLVDDGGSADAAVKAYTGWAGAVDLLLGPYSSGLVRAVLPAVRDVPLPLWNHGGSADDLARPGVICLAAPASSYFHAMVDEAVARHLERAVIVRGTGPFAGAVAGGAVSRAAERGIEVSVVDDQAVQTRDVRGSALLVAGSFEHDLGVVRRLRHLGQSPELLGAVAAGIQSFGHELGAAAEGVLGPVQWWPSASEPEVGPSGTDFADRYRRRTGREPSYVAAQAAAAGYLADAANQAGLNAGDLPTWATSTLLGAFVLDAEWHQAGHTVTVVSWRDGAMIPGLSA